MARQILITGAKRGLGLEFARQWLARGDRVFALARRPASSSALADLARRHPGALFTHDCDVADGGSVEKARRAVGKAWDRLDVVVNNAGIYGESVPIEGLDTEEVLRVFDINTVGPLRITRAFLPLLKQGISPRLVHITSLMGSIDDNRSGSHYAYRLSKAALNMASRNLAHDLRPAGIVSAVLHPGWVRTDMGGPQAPLSPEEAVGALIRTIYALGPAQSGGFYDRDGKSCAW